MNYSPALFSSRSMSWQQINRLLRRHSVQRLVMGLRIALLVLLFACAAWVVRELVIGYLDSQNNMIKVEETLRPLTAPTPVRDRPATTPRSVSGVEHNIFGAFTTKPVAPTAAPKPISQVPLDLIGTFVTPGEAPYAIIEDRNKRAQDIFRIGETIFGSAKLVKVFADHVEIDRNGQIEILSLDLMGASPPAAGKDGVASAGNNEYVVDEAEVDKALANLPLLLTQARAVPYFKDGQSVGLRLFAIKSDSLFDKIGLKNGDILKSINGNSLADLSQALKLFERLKEERSIAVALERNREEMEFKYQIR